VIASRSEKHLRLVLESSKGFAVDDAIAIVLEGRSDIVFGFRMQPPFRCARFCGLWGQDLPFALLQILADCPHQ
jgi:hypothetical protein